MSRVSHTGHSGASAARSLALVLLAMLAATVGGCSSGEQSPTPRRHAYPRIAVADSVYMAADSFAPHFEVNTAAVINRPAPGQLDISYPAYRATVYLTARRLPPERLESELDNRRERISLNLGGVAAYTEHITSDNGQFECALVTARDAATTPVQFLATDGEGCLISGAAYLGDLTPGTSADSIAPVVAALQRDIRHALHKLSDDSTAPI